MNFGRVTSITADNDMLMIIRAFYKGNQRQSDLGLSLDSKSADKELKTVTPEKSKTCVAALTKKLVTTFQLSKTKSGHFFLK